MCFFFVFFLSLKHLLFDLGCRVTSGLLKVFFFFCTVSFALWLHELTACPMLWCHDRGGWWALVSVSDLNWISYRLTLRISKSEKRKRKLPITKVLFFSPASYPSFPYCFEDNLQPYPKRLRCTQGADLSFYWPVCIFTVCWPI